MGFTQIIDKKEITIKGVEEENLICDFEWEKPKMLPTPVEEGGRIVIRRRKHYFSANNVKIKMDTSNKELIEKANMLVDGDIVNMSFHIPQNANYYDTDKWLILDLSDEIDLLEISNRNCLMTCDVPEKENIIEPKRKVTKKVNRVSKKDKRIAELEEENTQLKEENAQLKLQIQILKN